jgi:8-oxo-dGTP pyrophosphatase MutT (NUDIX family)
MNLLDQIERHDTRAGHAVSAKHQMGVIYLELGCWAEAEREFKSCIEKRGNEIWDHRRAYEHRRLGEVYALTDRPEDARREFEMAFKISSNCGHLKYTKRLKKNESVFLDIPEWLRREKPERVNLENLAKRYGLEPTELAPAFRVLHRRDLAYIPEIADNTGEPTGCAVRWDVAHTAKGAWHPTVSVLIINQQGEVALQKRAEHDSKGKLDVSVSGHVEIGETDTRCAIREVLEEAGIFIGAARLKRLFQPWELVKMGSPRTAIDKHARFDRYQYKTQKTNRERTSVYLLCVSDDEWKKRRPDAMQMKWFSFTKAVQMAHKTPNRFASGFRQLVNPTIIEVIQKRIVESTRTTGKTNHPEV